MTFKKTTMKRLPLIIVILLSFMAIAATTPFLIVIWLLGGNNPFKCIICAFDAIIGWDE